MTKIFSKLLLFTILFLVFPAVSFAQVSKIVFTTDSQTIKPNEISGAITIQTQNSIGNSFPTPETLDLEFISTSATGEFLNSAGNPATTYMSKNTANRTFYYRDSTEGNFTVSIKATGRESGKEWDTDQKIAISKSASTASESSNSSSNISVSTTSYSSEGSSNSISNPTSQSPDAKLEVITNGDRTTSPGSPIYFQAFVKKNTAQNSGVEFNWSFGDGNVGEGQTVNHVYKYPGEYVAVLNARAGNSYSVNRFKVRIVSPEISISEGEGYFEITNNSNTEINLFNWKIENGEKGFIFQPDTIILPHSSVKFDESLFKLKYSESNNLALKNYLGETIAYIENQNKKINLNDMSDNLALIEKEIYSLVNKAISAKLVTESSPIVQKTPLNYYGEVKGDYVEVEEAILEVSSSSTENIIYEVPKKEGIISRLTNFIKRVFSN